MSLGQSIRKSVTWLTVGNTGHQVLTFLVGIVMARLLAPKDFGMLATIQVFTGLAGFFAGGGMGQALVRAEAVSREDYDIVFTLQLIIGCLIFAGYFLAAPWFARWYNTPLYAELLQVSALSFLFRPFVNLPGSILQRAMRFREQTIVKIVSLVVTSGVSIGMAFTGYGVWSLIFGGIAGAITNMILLIPISQWKPGLSLDFRRGRDIARYGFLVTIGDLIVYVRSQAANFIISRTLGPQVLGLFNKANSLVLIPHGQVTSSVYKVTFRVLAKEHDNLDLSHYLFLHSITLVSLYIWPAFLAMAWLALPLIRFVYGEKWVDAATAMTWLAMIGPFIMLEILAGSVLGARNWLGREIPVQITQLVIVVLGVLGGLSHGLVGVALGASLANIYGALHMSWLSSQCLAMPFSRIFRAMVAPLLMNLAVLLLWLGIDKLIAPSEFMGDFFYLLGMLGSGGLLYILLFFLVPIPSIASEKKRWLGLLKHFLARNKKPGTTPQ